MGQKTKQDKKKKIEWAPTKEEMKWEEDKQKLKWG